MNPFRIGPPTSAILLALCAGLLLTAAGCASKKSNDDTSSWACTDTPFGAFPCHCQPSPVGGNNHIVDHCDHDSVPADAGGQPECCKQWLVLNGQRASAFYCGCYSTAEHMCDTPSGDEIVDRCP